ncbi:hypothetical protein [Anaerotruncus rubiinfantis]|jgi:hypothetical protein|uniref:hypothetical protein n=1 Tax=Anaerotruncus rubiinfantis TaxID=1720200 RepID=UPI00189869D2|nr:hypothetical protein [Anaerotruncus rubiinfantis]
MWIYYFLVVVGILVSTILIIAACQKSRQIIGRILSAILSVVFLGLTVWFVIMVPPPTNDSIATTLPVAASILESDEDSENNDDMEDSAEAILETSFPVEYAKRAAVVAITNALATDVFEADHNTIDTEKYHSYSDLSGYYMVVTSWGAWSAKDDVTWHVDGLEMHPNEYSTVACATLDVSFDGSNYVVSNVSGSFGKANDLSDIETFFDYADTFLIVSPTLIADDRS